MQSNFFIFKFKMLLNLIISDKANLRLMRYAVVFGLMIIYVLINNANIADYSNNLSLAEGARVSDTAKQNGDNIFRDKEINVLKDNIVKIKEASKSLKFFIILMCLIITILLISEFMKANKGTDDLDEIVDFAQAIAEGDLTQKNIEFISHTKFQIIGDALNNIRNTLSSFLLDTSVTVNQLATSSDHLIASSEIISQDTKEQIANTCKIANTVEMMSVIVFDVTRNSSIAANSAKDAAELAKKGGEIVVGTINGMNRISETVNESAHTIEVLGRKSEQIGEIIKVINNIANQTNLLALNAAIEAARAGDQGRGFAVVADEVRKLAERTTSATNEIADTIKNIQQETRKAVESMHSATKEVDTGVNLSKEADASLKQIVTSVENVMDLVQEIAAAAKQQSSTGEDVSTSLQEIANENKKTVEEAEKYVGATKELSAISQELRSLVSNYKIENGNNDHNVN